MKKMLNNVICISLAIFMCTTSAFAYNEGKSETEKFEEIQKKITELLVVEGDHYVYDKEAVISLVNEVNAERLNEEAGTTYSQESLKLDVLNKLDTFIIPNTVPETRGAYCNRNYQITRWNYERYYKSEGYANIWVSELNSQSTNDAVAGSIFGALGFSIPLIGGIGALLGIQSLWRLGLANAIANKNGTCGVVTDINIFTSAYSVNKQLDWWTYE